MEDTMRFQRLRGVVGPKAGIAWALAAFACGLSKGAVHDALQEGRDPSDALSAQLKSAPGEKPPELHRDTGRLLLERATLSLRKGAYASAVQDFAFADMVLDREDMRRMAKLKAMQQLGPFEACWQNGWGEALNIPYGPKVYERLLLNPLALVARLANNDAPGAVVEGRRFEVMDEFANSYAPGRARAVRSFAEGLSAIAFARNGDNDNACRAAKRASDEPAFKAACGTAGAPDDARSGAFLIVGYGQTPFIETDGATAEAKKRLVQPKNEGVGPRSIDVTLDGARVPAASVATLDVANEVRADFEDATTTPRIQVRVLGVAAQVPCGSASEAWDSLPAALHVVWVQAPPGPHTVVVSVNRVPQTIAVAVARERPTVIVRFVD